MPKGLIGAIRSGWEADRPISRFTARQVRFARTKYGRKLFDAPGCECFYRNCSLSIAGCFRMPAVLRNSTCRRYLRDAAASLSWWKLRGGDRFANFIGARWERSRAGLLASNAADDARKLRVKGIGTVVASEESSSTPLARLNNG